MVLSDLVFCVELFNFYFSIHFSVFNTKGRVVLVWHCVVFLLTLLVCFVKVRQCVSSCYLQLLQNLTFYYFSQHSFVLPASISSRISFNISKSTYINYPSQNLISESRRRGALILFLTFNLGFYIPSFNIWFNLLILKRLNSSTSKLKSNEVNFSLVLRKNYQD